MHVLMLWPPWPHCQHSILEFSALLPLRWWNPSLLLSDDWGSYRHILIIDVVNTHSWGDVVAMHVFGVRKDNKFLFWNVQYCLPNNLWSSHRNVWHANVYIIGSASCLLNFIPKHPAFQELWPLSMHAFNALSYRLQQEQRGYCERSIDEFVMKPLIAKPWHQFLIHHFWRRRFWDCVPSTKLLWSSGGTAGYKLWFCKINWCYYKRKLQYHP